LPGLSPLLPDLALYGAHLAGKSVSHFFIRARRYVCLVRAFSALSFWMMMLTVIARSFDFVSTLSTSFNRRHAVVAALIEVHDIVVKFHVLPPGVP
jgi:hypothetical protein